MKEVEIDNLLGIGCCDYHIQLGAKARLEIIDLQKRIDKAIEMIYKMTENELNYIHWKGEEVLVCGSDFEGAEILLDILKGSDSNE